MKTTLVKPETGKRKWYLIDAKDKVLGRVSTLIANKLRGKDKPIFSPQADYGDFVCVINCEKVKLSGKKESDKIYYWHTGYMGHLRQISAAALLKKNPRKLLEICVKGMLPKNRLQKAALMRLKLYVGETHPHTAQQPEQL